jgi:hypothetical protein
VVGLGLPLALALGAATGHLAWRMISLAAREEGIRIPTVVSPALTSRGIRAECGKISVMGPGQ